MIHQRKDKNIIFRVYFFLFYYYSSLFFSNEIDKLNATHFVILCFDIHHNDFDNDNRLISGPEIVLCNKTALIRVMIKLCKTKNNKRKNNDFRHLLQRQKNQNSIFFFNASIRFERFFICLFIEIFVYFKIYRWMYWFYLFGCSFHVFYCRIVVCFSWLVGVRMCRANGVYFAVSK